MNRDTRILSRKEGLVAVLSAGSALLIAMLGVSIWRFDISLQGGEAPASPLANQFIAASSAMTLVLCVARYLFDSRWYHFLYAGVGGVVSLVLLIPGMRWTLLSLGGSSIGHAIGFLIGVTASLAGVAGLAAAVFALREGKKQKAAQPGATDNPDDAQRSREDH